MPYTKLESQFGYLGHDMTVHKHERSFLGQLRLDLMSIYQETSPREEPYLLRFTISRQKPAPWHVTAKMWESIDMFERSFPTMRERDEAAERLRGDVVRRAAKAVM